MITLLVRWQLAGVQSDVPGPVACLLSRQCQSEESPWHHVNTEHWTSLYLFFRISADSSGSVQYQYDQYWDSVITIICRRDNENSPSRRCNFSRKIKENKLPDNNNATPCTTSPSPCPRPPAWPRQCGRNSFRLQDRARAGGGSAPDEEEAHGTRGDSGSCWRWTSTSSLFLSITIRDL